MASDSNDEQAASVYAELMTVDEKMVNFAWSDGNIGNVRMTIGGIKWELGISPGAGDQYPTLRVLAWPIEEKHLSVETTFTMLKLGGGIIYNEKVVVERMQIEKKDKASLQICTKKAINYRGYEVSAYVRVLRNCPLKPDYFTSVDSPHSLVLKVGDYLFYVDVQKLTALSSVFNAMLNGHFGESKQEEVAIGDVDPLLFNSFLRAILPADRVLPNPENVVELTELADRFDVPQLREDCARHLTVCPEIALTDRVEFAHRYGMKKTKACLVTQLDKEQLESLYANI